MKRTTLALTIILTLSILLTGILFNNFVNANPYFRDFVEEIEIPAPEGAEPITIQIFSPENHTAYASNNISLVFNVTWPESIDFFWSFQIYYKASWQPNKTYVDYGISARSNTINLTDIPEGSHFLEVVADAKYTGYTTRQETKGFYVTSYYVSYRLIGSSTVNFNVDLPPKISILSLENKTYGTSDVPLDFTVNEPCSSVAFSMDGKENVTASGNLTMSGLANGDHNITVFAMDEAGNTGTSETLFFSVDAPEVFPVVPVTAIAVAAVVLVAASLLGYLKKRRLKSGGKQ